MQETTEAVRRDIEATRMRVSQTLAELNGEVSGRRDAVTETIASARETVVTAGSQIQSTVTEFAREHPWYAVGAAVALGMLIGRSGADVAAARGVASGAGAAAKGVGGAAAGAAKSATTKVKSLVGRDGSGEHVASGAGMHAFDHDPSAGAIGSSAEDTGQVDQVAGAGGILRRLEAGLVDVVGGDALLADMRREAGKLSGDHWPVAEQPLK